MEKKPCIIEISSTIQDDLDEGSPKMKLRNSPRKTRRRRKRKRIRMPTKKEKPREIKERKPFKKKEKKEVKQCLVFSLISIYISFPNLHSLRNSN